MSDPIYLEAAARPTIRIERRYDHPVERVWRAVTAPESTVQWFPCRVEFDLVAGGAVRYDMEGHEQGEVLAVDPPRRLVFTWGADQLEFELRADGDGTVFVLTHAFDDRAGAASFASGWEACLDGLAAGLAGAPAPEPDRRDVRHEELVARFGLDRPVIIRGDAGWSVRVERQLVVPAETAWERLAAAPLGVPNVLVSLGAGTGHGARLVVAVNGSDAADLDAATAWVRAAVARVTG